MRCEPDFSGSSRLNRYADRYPRHTVANAAAAAWVRRRQQSAASRRMFADLCLKDEVGRLRQAPVHGIQAMREMELLGSAL